MDFDELYVARLNREPEKIQKAKKTDAELRSEIKKRIKLKTQLRDSEDKFDRLALSIQDAVIIIDYKQKVVNWNKAAEDMFGYRFEEVYGKNLHKLITTPEIAAKADIGFKKFAATGSGRYIDRIHEVNAVRKDGSLFRAEISISKVKIKGKNHVAGIVRDITDRILTQKRIMEAVEAAEAANIAKSQFLANMSHEIRTPMNGIIGFLELLSDTPLNSVQLDYVNEMKNASVSLLELINDLLDFSKIEANKMELENIEFNLAKLIEEISALFSVKACSKGIALKVYFDPSLPAFIKGDRRRLKQVIDNLVSNAVKFTKNGQVDVEIKKAAETADRVEVLFRVADTGIGISEHDITRLFTPFTQIDASTTRKYGGTGLGLAISSKIVEMMSSKINVKSEMGMGSAFDFTAGFDKAKDFCNTNVLCSTADCTPGNSDETWKRNVHILLAEDNPTNQKLAVSILKSAGLSCDIAENGIEAVNAVRTADYNLVLMDCQMPELDGYEATRLIRNIEAGERHVTIIAMTANALKSDHEKCLVSGMDDYISKPFKTSDLLKIIQKWVNADMKNGATCSRGEQMPVTEQNLAEIVRNLLPEVGTVLDGLAEEQKIDSEIIYEIFYEFTDTLPCQLDKINNAIDKGEFPALTMQAHTLKGSSSGLRLASISNKAAELEMKSREGNLCACREAAAELLECCRKYVSLLDS